MKSLFMWLLRVLGFYQYSVADVLEKAIGLKYYTTMPGFAPHRASYYMCNSVQGLFIDGVINRKEYDATINAISGWVRHDGKRRLYLWQLFQENPPLMTIFVNNQGIPFYKDKIKELRGVGNAISKTV